MPESPTAAAAPKLPKISRTLDEWKSLQARLAGISGLVHLKCRDGVVTMTRPQFDKAALRMVRQAIP